MDNKNKNDNNKKSNRNGLIIALIAAVSIFTLFSYLSRQFNESTHIQVTYNKFLDMLNEGEIESVTLKTDRMEIVPKEQPSNMYEISYYTGKIGDETLPDLLKEANAKNKIPLFFYSFRGIYRFFRRGHHRVAKFVVRLTRWT